MDRSGGHLFLIRGDLAWIRADVIVVPTADFGGSGGVYRALRETLTGEDRIAFERGYAAREHEIELPRRRPPRQVLVVRTATHADGATEGSVRAAIEQTFALLEKAVAPRSDGSERLTVAMPAFGSGKGTGRDAQKLAEAQVDGVLSWLRDHAAVDVVIVLNSESSYARFVAARARHRGPWDGSVITQVLGDLASDERIVPFIGAGVSKAEGVPDWAGLIRRMVNERPEMFRSLPPGCVGTEEEAHYQRLAEVFDAWLGGADHEELPALADEGDFQRLAEWYAGDDASHHELIGSLFSREATADHRTTVAQYLILQLPCRYVVTTNYDSFIEVALERLRRPYELVVRDEEVSASGDPGEVTVIKLHGTAGDNGDGAEGIVLTASEYKRFGRAEAEGKAALLQSLLLNHHVLFVGYGVRDPNLIAIRETVHRLTKRTSRRCWATKLGEPAGETGEALSWIPFQSPRDIEIFLDALAARTASRESSFLADQKWNGPADDPLRPIHAAVQEFARNGGALRAALDRPEEDIAFAEVRVLARLLEVLTALGWREPKDADLLRRWWSKLARVAERSGGSAALAQKLWRQAAAVGSSARSRELRGVEERLARRLEDDLRKVEAAIAAMS